MVEKIIINPEEVRGYGNICEEHSLEDFIVSSSGLAKEKETVHGALTNVYKLVYSLYGLMFYFDKGNKQLYLQMAESDILSFGFDTTNKQLYLVDVDDTGFNLGFDEDTNELYITDDAPPIVHNYSLAFISSSYVATGGSATLEITLLDNSVPVEGATISVSGSDGSLYTGITNNDGVAQVTVNNVSGTVTFTASYSNVSAQCTVTAQTYLFYDACDTTYDSSKYGSIIALSTSSQTNYTSYVSSENAYRVRADGDWALLPIPAMDNQDNYKISAYFKPVASSTHLYRGGFGFITEGTKYPFYHVRLQGNKDFTYARFQNGSEYEKQNTANIPITDYHRIEVIKQGNNYTFNLYDFDDTTILVTYSKTFSLTGTIKMGLYLCCGSNYGCYVKEIKAESL